MTDVMSEKKLISIVTPCYNEEENIDELCQRIAAVMATLPYDYEHICIDNASTDSTVEKIKYIAAKNKRIKLIVNARNFGHIKSSPLQNPCNPHECLRSGVNPDGQNSQIDIQWRLFSGSF